MTSEARKPLVITADLVEKCLDGLAVIMMNAGERGKNFLPIYQRLEDELAAMRKAEDTMSKARLRATRSMDRKAARSS